MINVLEENEAAYNDLQNLMKHKGWLFLVTIIEQKEIIPLFEKLSTYSYRTIEERNRDVDRLSFMKQLLNAPNIYSESLKLKEEAKKIELDPYEEKKE